MQLICQNNGCKYLNPLGIAGGALSVSNSGCPNMDAAGDGRQGFRVARDCENFAWSESGVTAAFQENSCSKN